MSSDAGAAGALAREETVLEQAAVRASSIPKHPHLFSSMAAKRSI
jgi:hypothetical protein